MTLPTNPITRLTSLLNDSDMTVRRYAIITLGKMGERAYPAVPHLTAILEDEKSLLRDEAADALAQIGTLRALRALYNAGYFGLFG